MKLYYSPGACSLAAHIVLEELQQPYQAIKVDLKTHTYNENEDYYKVTPTGYVPVLVLNDGNLITQNIAILTYLGELDSTHKLLPAVGTIHRTRCIEWLAFLNADVHKAFGPLFKAQNYVHSENAQQELKEQAKKNIQHLLTITDKCLANKTYAIGDQFTIADPYLYVLYRWASLLGINPSQWPHYTALIQRLANRAAVQNAMAAEGLADKA